MFSGWRVFLICVLVTGGVTANAFQPDDRAADALQTQKLLSGLRPLLSSLVGRESAFGISGTIELQIDGQMQSIDINMARFDDESFDLTLTHSEYALEIRRRSDITALALPKHGNVYVGRGVVAPGDRLSPKDLISRLMSKGSRVSEGIFYINMLSIADMDAILHGLLPNAKVTRDNANDSWVADGNVTITVPSAGAITARGDDFSVALTTTLQPGPVTSAEDWPSMQVTEISRDELERTLLRGVRRASEILAPSELLTKPDQSPREVANGRLIWEQGQRIALLRGTPEEIGTAHGQLLPSEAARCIESVLYSFGTVNVIRTGRWFRHDLEAAYARLAPHIPQRHKDETEALAVALNMDPQTVEALNVFPELFHCSGFAVFGSATKDGRMYHGRVLDYMTTIGLQDAATTFIIEAKDQIPFANVGYAGFIGSVSGMNAEAISLGEMGGRGEGQWDGAPMATLMRRAMEECRTLDEVKTLWANSPRTCEYYYVFADGKSNQAVGVAATPESIEFIAPGQGHERLGEGIPDSVVLSAGSRLEELRRRVTEKHGQIDAELGMWLMSRPVAMQSNLHNVLFVPQDRVLYVANASHKKPAAEMPYVRIDMNEMLATISQLPTLSVTPRSASVRRPAAAVNAVETTASPQE